MRPYHLLLYPFSFLYDGITRLRNRMFDRGVKKSVVFRIPTVVVGNLSMGGTGKTPMVEFLIRAFKDNYAVATLSRGYGRKTAGYLLADQSSGPAEIGDEPFQIYSKFGSEISVAVGEQRAEAIPQIIAGCPETELVILDDAFQHRYVKGDFNLLLTTFQRPFFTDHVVPMGMLRENRSGANRAHAVVVTKCPENLDEATKFQFVQKILGYAPKDCPVFFAGLEYGQPYNIRSNKEEPIQEVILLSGIANNSLLQKKVGETYELLETLEYSDHHHYTERDMGKISERFNIHKDKSPVLLTTEKDAVKLKADKLLRYLQEIPIFALPVQVKMEEEEKNTLLEHVTKAIRNKGYQREV
ncbi:tetraacyldisaccharide 4'-kinase [Echinicola soli]|uniref:Tetraacyldisaccharide 4'-kinase n=1 Tax=Echinicola soli TaxID=2591634 RepID=A0A514CIA8_9BACT|nr:tetraacyldisaccharide 4'-kinase [Echinicola soli]QDH79558.1 tetraacyldisaccharide 4'-kinase [Echinicola soli]